MKRWNLSQLCGALLLLACTAPLQAAEDREAEGVDLSSNFALGYDIDSYSSNFAGGITLASPHFCNEKMWIQLSSDIAWVQGVQNGASATTWAPYGLFKLGVLAGHFLQNTPLRVYGGGGVVLITFANSVSSASSIGGYGVAGVEFFMNKKNSRGLFMELGGMGTGAQADKLVSTPIYANGFTISWGYKFYL